MQLQPNSRHCFVCGLENEHGLHLRFYETAEGEVTKVKLLSRRQFRNIFRDILGLFMAES